MDYDWIPLLRLGPLKFGADVRPLVERGVIVPMLYDDDLTGWETFGYGGDAVRVHVENGRIVSVACYDRCLLRGENVIGMDHDVAVRHIGFSPTGNPDTIVISDEPQQIFEFEEVGAQVWVKDGTVVTVFCSGDD